MINRSISITSGGLPPLIVTGQVFSNDMVIIPNANVEVVDENKFTTTDENGKFSIAASSGKAVLKFSHVAYDYDSITVDEFKQVGYVELYPNSLDGATVVNNAKGSNNTLLYTLGALGVAGLIALVSKSKTQKVKL